MVESQSLLAKFTYVVGEQIALRLQVPVPTEAADASVQGLHAIFAVDKSGSMSGGPMNDARGALLSLIKKFQKVDVPVSVYAFDTHFKFYNSTAMGYDVMYQECEKIRAGGGTYFDPVIKQQIQEIKSADFSNVFIVWLSDGQDNNGLQNLIPTMDLFKKTMEDQGISAAVHTIGFSSGHDAELLGRLAQSGARPGTFQYVPEGGRIPIAVNNVYELAFESSVWARLISQNGTKMKRIKLEEDPSNKEFMLAACYLSEEDMEDCKLEVHQGEAVYLYDLDFQRVETNDLSELVHTVTKFISFKVMEALEDKQTTLESLRALIPLVEEMERRLNDLTAELSSLRIFARKQLEPFINASKDLISKFNSMIRDSSSQGLDNVALAELNSAANTVLLKKTLEKKINKAAGNNYSDLSASELEMERIRKTQNLDEIRAKNPQTETVGRCALTGKNWLDAVAEGDCLCITFELDRPKGGLSDPLEFKIVKVNDIILSVEAFIGSPLFQGKVGQIIEGGSRFTQDVECPTASSLVTGLSEEKINAVLPLYINDDHWRLASLRVKPMMGWNIVVDVLGFEPVQKLTLPYMLLARAAADLEDEYSRHKLELIKDTVIQIYKEDRDTILPALREKLASYDSEPLIRLPDSIPSNEVFLAQLFCAFALGDVDKVAHIFPRIFEEQICRASKKFPAQDLAKKLLDIDPSKYTSSIDVNKLFEDYRKAAAGEAADVKEDKFEFTGRIEMFSDPAIQVIDGLHKQMAGKGSIGKILGLMTLFGENKYNSVADAGIHTNEQVLALIIQAAKYKNDDERKQDIIKGEYCDVRNPDACTVFIKNTYTKTVNQEILSFKTIAMKEFTKHNSANALQFAMTSSLDVASKLLYGIMQGSTLFSEYYKVLLAGGAPYVIEKIKMLVSGEYMGVRLICDKKKNGEHIAPWNPKTKYVYKLWSKYHGAGTLEQWQDAIPGRALYLEHQEARRQGNFVPYSKPKSNCKDSRHNWGSKSQSPAQRGRGGRGRRGRGRGRP
jgi:hypothetical protein